MYCKLRTVGFYLKLISFLLLVRKLKYKLFFNKQEHNLLRTSCLSCSEGGQYYLEGKTLSSGQILTQFTKMQISI